MYKSSYYNGIFLGIAMIISTYVLYIANKSLFLSSRSILLIIFILLIVKSGLEARNANGGFITFGQIFKNMFVTGTVGIVLCTPFEYIMMNYIDPDLIEMQKEISLEAAEQARDFLSGIGGEEFDNQFDEELEKIENTNPFSAMNSIRTLLIRLIAPIALLSALFGLILKKNKPQDPNESSQKNQRYIVNK